MASRLLALSATRAAEPSVHPAAEDGPSNGKGYAGNNDCPKHLPVDALEKATRPGIEERIRYRDNHNDKNTYGCAASGAQHRALAREAGANQGRGRNECSNRPDKSACCGQRSNIYYRPTDREEEQA
jgi:hypothetical protein